MMDSCPPWPDWAAGVAWTTARPFPGGWRRQGYGPVRALPADFTPFWPLFPGDDERRWVSVRRQAVVVEAPGSEGTPVVWVDTYDTLIGLARRVWNELPAEAQPAAVTAMIRGGRLS